MVSGLQEINPVIAHQVNKSVLLGDSPRPRAGCKVLQWFRFTNARKRITLDCFDQLEDFERDVPFGFDPESQILEKFAFEKPFLVSLVFFGQIWVSTWLSLPFTNPQLVSIPGSRAVHHHWQALVVRHSAGVARF